MNSIINQVGKNYYMFVGAGYLIKPGFSFGEKVSIVGFPEEFYYVHTIRGELSTYKEDSHKYSYLLVPNKEDLDWPWNEAFNGKIIEEHRLVKL